MPTRRRTPASRGRSKSPRRPAPEVLTGTIRRDRRLGTSRTWVIVGEVRVSPGITLTIADGTTILLANGVAPQSCLRRSALIFDPGSSLIAGRVTLRACAANHRPVRTADNGGLWFLGTFSAGSKDGIAVRRRRGSRPSAFQARSITVSYLGRHDSRGNPKTREGLDTGDDIDGISLVGVGPDEWHVSEVRSLYSGDDGFDVTNSDVHLNRLEVRHPAEDGLNVSSSRVEIRRSLVLDVPKSRNADRNLFDLETDDGGSSVELPRGCWVRLRGVFGDQLRLTSSDMPRPRLTDDNERPYRFAGRLQNEARIHSLTAD